MCLQVRVMCVRWREGHGWRGIWRAIVKLGRNKPGVNDKSANAPNQGLQHPKQTNDVLGTVVQWCEVGSTPEKDDQGQAQAQLVVEWHAHEGPHLADTCRFSLQR